MKENVRRIVAGLILLIMLTMTGMVSNKIYATEETTNETIFLGLTMWRENAQDSFYENIVGTGTGRSDSGKLVAYITGAEQITGSEDPTNRSVNIGKIVKQNGAEIDDSMPIYCLKAEKGFADVSSSSTTTTEGIAYNKSYNLYQDQQAIMDELEIEDETTYKKIIWILEHLYAEGQQDEVAKEHLLQEAGVTTIIDNYKANIEEYNEVEGKEVAYEDFNLTDNDIEVVQQMALWYFTNGGERYQTAELGQLRLAFKEEYSETDPYPFETFVSRYNYYIDGEDEIRWGSVRQDACEALWKYLIDGANDAVTDSWTPSKNIKATVWTHDTELRQPVVIIEKGNFDLALRKFITAKETVENGEEYKESAYVNRVPNITEEQLEKLANGEIQTVEKTHSKTPVEVKTGDIVTYTIRIYNEGDIAGYANVVTDHLPSGLKFVPTEESEINNTYGWKVSSDGRTVTTEYLKDYLIPAFEGEELHYVDLEIECEVTETNADSSGEKTLKNVAEITQAQDEARNPMNLEGDDRDSTPGNLTPEQKQNYFPGESEKGWGYEDDDDYEELILPAKQVDFALRKFITAIGDKELKEADGTYTREPKVDVSELNTWKDGKLVTTATYNHPKKPISVEKGDIVTYTIRVYNEGDIDGYISEITDHLPNWLEFINTENAVTDEEKAAAQFNLDYLWTEEEEGIIKTKITAKNTASGTEDEDDIYGKRENGKLLKAFVDRETLDFIDVQIKCKVKDIAEPKIKMTNIAEITGMTDATGEEGVLTEDRDSGVLPKAENEEKHLAEIPTEADLPGYKQDEINSGKAYIEGQEDDDDFEKVIIQVFDLALRKFITEVDGMPINNRYPTPRWDETLNRIVYDHPKTPVDVEYGDVVIYTIRVYNEGNVAGFAQEVTDDLPEYLTYLPEHQINQDYGWVLRDAEGNEVDSVEEATCITTDFLSKDKGAIIDNEDGTTTNSNLLNPFEKDMPISNDNPRNPDYRDLQVAMRVDLQVTKDNLEDSKRILINEAQISDDADENGGLIDDVDSDPNRDDKYNYDGENEDDIDYEPVKVKYFDLALKKWVTQAIVTENGKTTVTESGHTGDENPEPPMKVEIKSKNINKVTVKFRFSIKVTNQGEIEGYATEVTDHVPAGLEFRQEDNPDWYVKDGNLVATRALENTLLQPGESATVEIVLTWINGNENFGEKTNYAEISEDKNPSNTPDIDSTPGNLEGDPKEDDEDQAPVVLSIKTGETPKYFALTSSIIGMFTGGVLMIKKYVI